MHKHLFSIANELKKRFVNEDENEGEINLFLCGGSSEKENKLRKTLGERISQKTSKSKYKYSVYFPEDMFIELIQGHQRHNLLTLENILANSVHSVVILLQSPGTFTELGAFSNHDSLKNKLVVVTDPKYEKKKSFINLGPIRLLKKSTKSKIIYSVLNMENCDYLVKKISEDVRAIAKHASVKKDLSNPIMAYKFYLALIYVFGPFPRILIYDILENFRYNNPVIEEDKTVADTVVNSLISERKISTNAGSLQVTPKGIKSLIYNYDTKKREKELMEFFRRYRIEALNLILRKNGFGVRRNDLSQACQKRQV